MVWDFDASDSEAFGDYMTWGSIVLGFFCIGSNSLRLTDRRLWNFDGLSLKVSTLRVSGDPMI